VLAEVTAREIGRVMIAEALELTALVACKQPERYGRFTRPLALFLARGARSSEPRRCRAARLEPAVARQPKDHAAAVAILRKVARQGWLAAR
jgi:hypothetical protein